jgi:hypothetical protein
MASSVKYSPGDALKCRDTHNTGRKLVPNEKKLIHRTCIHIVDNYFWGANIGCDLIHVVWSNL